MPETRNVAIVGGGIAGLVSAYYLHGKESKDGKYVYACAVFEKSDRLGGNGLTAYFDKPYEKPFADLGVNDFNLAMYVHMAEILETLNELGFPVPTGRLNDSECFFTAAEDTLQPPVVYTNDDLLPDGPEPARTIYNDLQKFEKLAYDVLHKQKYARMSVDEFLESEGFSAAFRDYFILPRINAMYFMGETTPEAMPIAGVMNYYSFQEGIGSGKPADRRYFARGCDQWFLQLSQALQSRGVRIFTGTEVTVHRAGGVLTVQSDGMEDLEVDQVILATHADRVADVVRSGLPEGMPRLLSQFRYINSIAIAHTWPGVMPADRGMWRTYNIRIQPRDARMLRPYNISYVESMHQGGFTPTDHFVTEDPHLPIPLRHIRTMVDPVTREKRRATAYFRHNTITLESMQAQGELSDFYRARTASGTRAGGPTARGCTRRSWSWRRRWPSASAARTWARCTPGAHGIPTTSRSTSARPLPPSRSRGTTPARTCRTACSSSPDHERARAANAVRARRLR
jgi:predicted NAD/FAD-binding protein